MSAKVTCPACGLTAAPKLLLRRLSDEGERMVYAIESYSCQRCGGSVDEESARNARIPIRLAAPAIDKVVASYYEKHPFDPARNGQRDKPQDEGFA